MFSSLIYISLVGLDEQARDRKPEVYRTTGANEFNFNVHERMMEPTDAPYKRRETEMQTEKERDVGENGEWDGAWGDASNT